MAFILACMQYYKHPFPVECFRCNENHYYNFKSCFSSLRSSFMMRRNKDNRRFIYYSIYAWGTPLIWTTITILIDQNKWLPNKWSPTMAVYGNQCWFSRECFPLNSM